MPSKLEPTGTKVLGLWDGTEQERFLSEVVAELGVESTIRIMEWEFSLLPQNEVFVHFNMLASLHLVGRPYAIVPILRLGVHSKGILPLVDYGQAVIVQATEVRDKISYEDVTEEEFRYSFPHIKNIGQLKAMILHRYWGGYPDISAEEMLRRPISATRLTFI